MKRLFTIIPDSRCSCMPLLNLLKIGLYHNDPAKYRELSAVHAGAGKMGFTQLIGRRNYQQTFFICMPALSMRSQVSAITFIIILRKCMFF